MSDIQTELAEAGLHWCIEKRIGEAYSACVTDNPSNVVYIFEGMKGTDGIADGNSIDEALKNALADHIRRKAK